MLETARAVFEDMGCGEDVKWRISALEFHELSELRRLCNERFLDLKGVASAAAKDERDRLTQCRKTAQTRLNEEAPPHLAHGVTDLCKSIDAASASSTRIGNRMIALTVVIAIAAGVGVTDILVRLLT